jgi:DNA mismatch repair protein MutS
LNDLASLYPRVKNFHVTVKEVGKQVIFLRKIKEGGTAHSFGIHVARMAGMPHEVLAEAERTLAALESGSGPSVLASENVGDGTDRATFSQVYRSEGRPVSDESDGIQLSLFQLDDPTLTSLRDQLREADLNNMTPMQAFDLLRSMKAELGL